MRKIVLDSLNILSLQYFYKKLQETTRRRLEDTLMSVYHDRWRDKSTNKDR